MALLAIQQIKITGLNPSMAAAAASDTVDVKDDRVFLLYRNTNAATRTIEVVTPAKFDQFGQGLPNISVVIAATTGEELIPIPSILADPATGLVTATVSATAGVTVAAIRI